VLKRTSLFVQTILAGPVPRPLTPTLYRRFGDWFMAACMLGLLVGLVVQRIRMRRAAS